MKKHENRHGEHFSSPGFSVFKSAAFFWVLSLFVCLQIPEAIGAVIDVTHTADVVDANGGDCSTMTIASLPGPDGETSLREAICAANYESGDDTINLPEGTYPLTIIETPKVPPWTPKGSEEELPAGGIATSMRAGENANESGDLDITGNLTISGAGSSTTVVDASNVNDRVFHIEGGDTVQINDITITGGHLTDGSARGGGIYCSADLTLQRCLVTGNTAEGGAEGGGIGVVNGSVTLIETTVTQNQALGKEIDDGLGHVYGGGAFGGGIDCVEGSVSLENSSVTGNNATAQDAQTAQSGMDDNGAGWSAYGGGISAACDVTLTSSQVTGNTATGGNSFDPDQARGGSSSGGGIYVAGRFSVTDSNVSSNTAQGGQGEDGGQANGGGIFFESYTSIESTNTTISQNNALAGAGTGSAGYGGDARGGGVYAGNLSSGESAIFSACAIEGNHASGANGVAQGGDGSGGGLHIEGSGDLVVRDSLVSGNSVSAGTPDVQGNEGSGGAMYLGGYLNASVVNSTFSGNTTQDNGGGAYHDSYPTLAIRHATITDNTAQNGDGGGLFVYDYGANDGTANLGHVILAANTDSGAGNNHPDCSGPVVSSGYNILGDVAGCTGIVDGTDNDRAGTAASPIDPVLGPLQDNGGQSRTHALLSGSPALDTGDSSFDENSFTPSLTTDQRGTGFPRVQNNTIDIGAFERAPAPEIEVSESDSDVPDNDGSVDYGTTTVGYAITKTFTISNTGNAELTLSAPSSIPDGFSRVGTFPSSIAAGGSEMFQVRLDADAAGSFSGRISFANNDSDENPYDFAISGVVNVPPAPEIEVSESGSDVPDNDGSVDYGTTTVGYAITKTFTISNTGNAELTLSAPTSIPDGFSRVGTFPSSIAAGGSEMFQVRLDADAAGSFSGRISFANNDSDENPYDFAISGVVNVPPAPEIEVSESGSDVPDNDGSVDYGTTTVGYAITKTFTISNTGNAELTLSAPTSIPDGFSRVGTFPSSIAAGGSEMFQVRLDADAAGSFSGRISFANNDSDENPYDFAISGVVDVPPAPEIEVSESGSDVPDNDGSVDYGTTTVGYAITKTFTISNTGNAELTLSEPSSIPDGFSRVGTFPSSIAAGGFETFQVRLDADAAGSFSGRVSFANNDSDENPYDFAVAGVVNVPPAPEIEVSESGSDVPDNDGSVDYGTTTVGNPVIKTFTISNTGNAELNVSAPFIADGFSLVGTFPASIAASGSDTFQVRLDADAAGSFSGRVSFANNDDDENSYDFAILGTVQGVIIPTVDQWGVAGLALLLFLVAILKKHKGRADMKKSPY